MSKPKGRPAGSKNHEYADAVEIPAACPACGSNSLAALRGNKVTELEHPGEINGQSYTRIEWHDKTCECGQHVRVRRYLNG